MISAGVVPLASGKQAALRQGLGEADHQRPPRPLPHVLELGDDEDLFDLDRVEAQFLETGRREDLDRQEFHFRRGDHVPRMGHGGQHRIRRDVAAVDARSAVARLRLAAPTPPPSRQSDSPTTERNQLIQRGRVLCMTCSLLLGFFGTVVASRLCFRLYKDLFFNHLRLPAAPRLGPETS